MRIVAIDLRADLMREAFAHIRNKTVLIFPTRVAAELARKEYEKNWQLLDIQWLAMEEFKESLCFPKQPLIADDKRLLALYQVLTEEDKDYFHISDYDDLVSWGINFFKFLDENQEAGYDALALEKLIELEMRMREWQEDHLNRLSQIVLRYKEFIGERGFTDKLFIPLPESGEIPFTGKRIMIINQYYYSPREEELLRRCKDGGNELILFYHGIKPKEGKLNVEVFDARKAWESLDEKPNIRLKHCANEDAAALEFIRSQSPKEASAIIDNQFLNSSYSAYFPPELVSPPNVFPIVHSNWFRMLSFLRELALDPSTNKGYVPLAIIMRYCLDIRLNQCLVDDWDEAKQEQLRKAIFKFSDNQVLYFDIEKEQNFGIKKEDETLCELLESLFDILKIVLALTNVDELIDLIDKELNPQDFCSAEEMTKSSILEEIWKALANFATAEKLGIVSDWQDIFDNPGAGIFSLWVDFVKSQRLKFKPKTPSKNWQVSNLFDSRNRIYPNVAFLQCVEGILPQNPAPTWLLNEAQKQRLGFLAYDTIRAWERYYFMRLVFLAKEVDIYTYSNIEENVHPSSFVEELCTFVDGLEMQRSEHQLSKLDINELFGSRPQICSAESKEFIHENTAFLKNPDEHFYHLPTSPQTDFNGSKTIVFGSDSLIRLCVNPFAWYIHNNRRIRALETDLKETIQPLLFGSFMHKYFEEILGLKTRKIDHVSELKSMFTDEDFLKTKLLELIDSPEFRYKIPKNYNSDFLKEIISDRLVLSLQEFYHEFMIKSLKSQSFTMIPENSDIPGGKNLIKFLPPPDDYEEEYLPKLNGRADLRIDAQDSYYIIDFKTGGSDYRQLAFYEWLYEGYFDTKTVVSSFWRILDMERDRDQSINDNKKNRFYEQIFESLSRCLSFGYEVPERGAGRDMLQTITRSDLIVQGAQK